MPRRIDEALKVSRIILETLEDGPCRWTQLYKAAVNRSPTPWRFRSALEWLLANGYLKHDPRGEYEITEEGRGMLRILKV